MAARFLYLNKTCFNGLYRVNKSGYFNTPMGSYKNPSIVQEDNIRACNIALQKARLVHGDFEIVRNFVQKGDFVYFDPPYHPTTETSFTAYTEHSFTEKDQVRLRDFLLELHKKGTYIMLSNSKTKLIEDIYRHKYFTKHIVRAPRFVNCKPQERNKIEEYLITNY
jgi:DNA adenine methylase